LGVLGFCYIPYHYVYDVSFPVLVQLYQDGEIFQFPVVVIIDNNYPRDALESEFPLQQDDEFDLCQYRTQEVTVTSFDNNLNPVEANVSYQCFDQQCRLGETKNGELKTFAPACVNGFVLARADGFAEVRQEFSSNDEEFADILMEREYDVELEVVVGGQELEDTAIVSFVRDDGKTVSAAMPEIESVELSEGEYEIRVYVYGNSSISIPESTKTECVEVPRGGLLGLFGSTEEKCFDVTIPATDVDTALIGGGNLETYLLESELQAGKMILHVDRLPEPKTLEGLAENFGSFENKRLWFEFEDV